MVPDPMASARSILEVVRGTGNAAKGAGGGPGGVGRGLGQGHPVVQELAVSLNLGSIQLQVINLTNF